MRGKSRVLDLRGFPVKQEVFGLDTLDTKAADEIEQNRSKLYGNWKALDWIAETPDEKKKAGEAKRLYDEYLKKYPPK